MKESYRQIKRAIEWGTSAKDMIARLQGNARASREIAKTCWEGDRAGQMRLYNKGMRLAREVKQALREPITLALALYGLYGDDGEFRGEIWNKHSMVWSWVRQGKRDGII